MRTETLLALQAAQQKVLGERRGRTTELHLHIKNKLFPQTPHVFSSVRAVVMGLKLPRAARSKHLKHLKLTKTSGYLQVHESLMVTWRLSKRVFTFHDDFFEVLTRTPSVRSLPTELLLRMPDWSFFVELPEQHIHPSCSGNIIGFFMHVDADLHLRKPSQSHYFYTAEEFRRYGVNTEEDYWKKLDTLFSLKTPVYYMSFLNSQGEICAMQGLTPEQDYAEIPAFDIYTGKMQLDGNDVLNQEDFMGRMLNVLMYLCSVKADYQRPGPQVSTSRVKHSYHPVEHVQTVPVGYRIGAALTEARRQYESQPRGHGSSIPPHVRSPHWHLYWTGKRTEAQSRVVHWMPPIPVNMDLGDELPPSSHRVLPPTLHP